MKHGYWQDKFCWKYLLSRFTITQDSFQAIIEQFIIRTRILDSVNTHVPHIPQKLSLTGRTAKRRMPLWLNERVKDLEEEVGLRVVQTNERRQGLSYLYEPETQLRLKLDEQSVSNFEREMAKGVMLTTRLLQICQ